MLWMKVPSLEKQIFCTDIAYQSHDSGERSLLIQTRALETKAHAKTIFQTEPIDL